MKKILLVFFAALMLCLPMLGGCNQNVKFEGTQKLTFEKRYILYNEIHLEKERQKYYLFRSDGTGEFRYFIDSSFEDNVRIYDYKISFRYIVIGDTVICLYDSITYLPDDTMKSTQSVFWQSKLGFSEDVLMAIDASATLYLCEDFLPEIPNFGKQEEE